MSFARPQPCEYRFLSALGGQLAAFTRRYADENRAAPQTAFSAASDELFFRQKSKNRRAKVTPRYDEGFRTADGGRYNIDDYRISAYSYRAKAHTSPAARHTAVRAYIYICRRMPPCTVYAGITPPAIGNSYILSVKNHIKNLYKNQPWRP